MKLVAQMSATYELISCHLPLQGYYSAFVSPIIMYKLVDDSGISFLYELTYIIGCPLLIKYQNMFSDWRIQGYLCK